MQCATIYLTDWQLICPTGGWFWLWRRDLLKPHPLPNAWTPTAATMAHHIIATLMTSTYTHTHTHTHILIIISFHNHRPREHTTLSHPFRDVCRTFAARQFFFFFPDRQPHQQLFQCHHWFVNSLPVCKRSFSPILQCQRVLIHLFFVSFKDWKASTGLNCTRFHGILLYTILWCKSKS